MCIIAWIAELKADNRTHEEVLAVLWLLDRGGTDVVILIFIYGMEGKNGQLFV